MPRRIPPLAAAIAIVIAGAPAAGAQDTPPAPSTPPPAVGTMAPDFSIPGATRYGLLTDPVRLSDYRGKTVVISFFFRARTRG
jgi:hypothetical protein